MPARGSAGRCGSRAATTRCATATSSRSSSRRRDVVDLDELELGARALEQVAVRRAARVVEVGSEALLSGEAEHVHLAVAGRAAQPSLEARAVLLQERQDGVLVALEALHRLRRGAGDDDERKSHSGAPAYVAGAPVRVQAFATARRRTRRWRG